MASTNPFSTRALAIIIGAGVVLLVGFLLMSGFGGALMPANPIHPSATSRAGIGFAGLRQIVERTGLAGEDGNAIGDRDHPGLLILTPRIDTTEQQIAEILSHRAAEELATLIILPKWAVSPMDTNRNWATEHGLVPTNVLTTMAPGAPLQVRRGGGTNQRVSPYEGAPEFDLPPTIQVTVPDVVPDPDMVDREGRVILFHLATNSDVHVLTDPDLLNNLGMKSAANAQAGIVMLRDISPELPADIAFDMTLPKGGAERNLIQLMFAPPFLAVTIAVFAAALLAGFASANRFGPVRREGRAVAFGKAALIDNIAGLTRAAGRVAQGGTRHADAARERLRTRLHAPPRLDGEELVAWIDARHPGYRDIDHRLRTARSEGALLDAARDLDDWQKETTR